jgi:hypothetical protein
MRTVTPFRKITLPEVIDDRGRLMFAEDESHIPFTIRRLFAIYGIVAGATRGGHAHRVQHQFLIMLSGACTLDIDTGVERVAERMEGPTEGLYVPPKVWIELRNFVPGSVCLVLASAHYDAADYIRDYDEFKQLSAVD